MSEKMKKYCESLSDEDRRAIFTLVCETTIKEVYRMPMPVTKCTHHLALIALSKTAMIIEREVYHGLPICLAQVMSHAICNEKFNDILDCICDSNNLGRSEGRGDEIFRTN